MPFSSRRYHPNHLPEDAASLDKKCFNENSGSACFDLAWSFLNGSGAVPRNPCAASEIFQKGCHLGEARACSQFAIQVNSPYLDTTIDERSPPSALPAFSFQETAEKEVKRGCFDLHHPQSCFFFAARKLQDSLPNSKMVEQAVDAFRKAFQILEVETRHSLSDRVDDKQSSPSAFAKDITKESDIRKMASSSWLFASALSFMPQIIQKFPGTALLVRDFPLISDQQSVESIQGILLEKSRFLYGSLCLNNIKEALSYSHRIAAQYGNTLTEAELSPFLLWESKLDSPLASMPLSESEFNDRACYWMMKTNKEIDQLDQREFQREQQSPLQLSDRTSELNILSVSCVLGDPKSCDQLASLINPFPKQSDEETNELIENLIHNENSKVLAKDSDSEFIQRLKVRKARKIYIHGMICSQGYHPIMTQEQLASISRPDNRHPFAHLTTFEHQNRMKRQRKLVTDVVASFPDPGELDHIHLDDSGTKLYDLTERLRRLAPHWKEEGSAWFFLQRACDLEPGLCLSAATLLREIQENSSASFYFSRCCNEGNRMECCVEKSLRSKGQRV